MNQFIIVLNNLGTTDQNDIISIQQDDNATNNQNDEVSTPQGNASHSSYTNTITEESDKDNLSIINEASGI